MQRNRELGIHTPRTSSPRSAAAAPLAAASAAEATSYGATRPRTRVSRRRSVPSPVPAAATDGGRETRVRDLAVSYRIVSYDTIRYVCSNPGGDQSTTGCTGQAFGDCLDDMTGRGWVGLVRAEPRLRFA